MALFYVSAMTSHAMVALYYSILTQNHALFESELCLDHAMIRAVLCLNYAMLYLVYALFCPRCTLHCLSLTLQNLSQALGYF